MELSDKVALITGGKRIGLVVARELAARGVDIALSYARSRVEAERAAELVRAAKRRATAFQARSSSLRTAPAGPKSGPGSQSGSQPGAECCPAPASCNPFIPVGDATFCISPTARPFRRTPAIHFGFGSL
jgi:hypothetical protein